MAGVQNLRAMFEKGSESSSPDRGRSGPSPEETPPRPLSKVRTSFVSVERSDRRSVSTEDKGKLRISSGIPNEKLYGAALNKSVVEKTAAGELALNSSNSTKEKMTQPTSENSLKEKNSESTSDASVITKSKIVNRSKTAKTNKMLKTDTSHTPPKASTPVTPNKQTVKATNTSTPRSSNIADKDRKQIRTSTVPKIDSKSTGRSRPQSISVNVKTLTQEPLKSARIRKLEPKSTARSVKPPISSTVHTTSSDLKVTKSASTINGRLDNRRTSNKMQQPPRPQSRMSIISSAHLNSGFQVKKRLSTSSNPADSIRKSSRQSILSQNAPAELSFLARMTRPTASSASKIQEKPLSTNKKLNSIKQLKTRSPARDNSSKYEVKKKPSVSIGEKKISLSEEQNISSSIIKDSSNKKFGTTTLESIKTTQEDIMVTPVASKKPDIQHLVPANLIGIEKKQLDITQSNDITSQSSKNLDDKSEKPVTTISSNLEPSDKFTKSVTSKSNSINDEKKTPTQEEIKDELTLLENTLLKNHDDKKINLLAQNSSFPKDLSVDSRRCSISEGKIVREHNMPTPSNDIRPMGNHNCEVTEHESAESNISKNITNLEKLENSPNSNEGEKTSCPTLESQVNTQTLDIEDSNQVMGQALEFVKDSVRAQNLTINSGLESGEQGPSTPKTNLSPRTSHQIPQDDFLNSIDMPSSGELIQEVPEELESKLSSTSLILPSPSDFEIHGSDNLQSSVPVNEVS